MRQTWERGWRGFRGLIHMGLAPIEATLGPSVRQKPGDHEPKAQGLQYQCKQPISFEAIAAATSMHEFLHQGGGIERYGSTEVDIEILERKGERVAQHKVSQDLLGDASGSCVADALEVRRNVGGGQRHHQTLVV